MAHKRRYKGFDYGARDPKRPQFRGGADPGAPGPVPLPNLEPVGEWVHKGGGWYENTVTGERQKGKP